LSALKIDLARLTARLPEQSEVLRTRTREMAALIDTAMESALQIASDSRPGILDNLGLEAALDWEARRFQGRTGIQCEVTPTFEEVDLDRERRTMMFRIFQEILANVARHAQATRVTVGLQRQGDRFLLTVKDDGRGISGREIADQKSLGLLGMRERAIVLGGDLRIASGPGRGTKVTLIVPVSRSSSLTTKAE
jgi:signal transduction histidine kinase